MAVGRIVAIAQAGLAIALLSVPNVFGPFFAPSSEFAVSTLALSAEVATAYGATLLVASVMMGAGQAEGRALSRALAGAFVVYGVSVAGSGGTFVAAGVGIAWFAVLFVRRLQHTTAHPRLEGYRTAPGTIGTTSSRERVRPHALAATLQLSVALSVLVVLTRWWARYTPHDSPSGCVAGLGGAIEAGIHLAAALVGLYAVLVAIAAVAMHRRGARAALPSYLLAVPGVSLSVLVAPYTRLPIVCAIVWSLALAVALVEEQFNKGSLRHE